MWHFKEVKVCFSGLFTDFWRVCESCRLCSQMTSLFLLFQQLHWTFPPLSSRLLSSDSEPEASGPNIWIINHSTVAVQLIAAQTQRLSAGHKSSLRSHKSAAASDLSDLLREEEAADSAFFIFQQDEGVEGEQNLCDEAGSVSSRWKRAAEESSQWRPAGGLFQRGQEQLETSYLLQTAPLTASLRSFISLCTNLEGRA